MTLSEDFVGLRACHDRILSVLSEGEMTRTQLVRRCTAHPSERFRAALDMLAEAGRVEMRLQGFGRRAATLVRLSQPTREEPDPCLVRMRPEVVEAQRESVAQVNRWFASLETDKTNSILWSAKLPLVLAAREMLVKLYRDPWLYAAEVPTWKLLGDIADCRGDAPSKKALRKLAEMGVIILKERRGSGRTSTFRLVHVPPYPMA